jgi:hypothetical protein
VIGPALGMIVLALAGWAGAVLVWGPAVARDVGLGVAGPLAAALASWVMIARTVRRDPSRLTVRMFGALGAKMVFFAAFVVWAIRGVHVAPIAFVVSLTAAFITLHGVEAVVLRRALAGLTSGAPREASRV